MRGKSNALTSVLAVLTICITRLVSADITVDAYSLLTPTPTAGATNYALDITIAGIASVSAQPDGETVYAETVVETKEALVDGTTTLTTLISIPTTLVQTFTEDASRLSASVMMTQTLSVPGFGIGMVTSVGIQQMCTGAVGAPATCIEEYAESYTAGGTVDMFTVTYSAVRTPIFTITSSSAREVGPPALVVMALAVGAVCSIL